ncbi:MAG: outer membrane beta-barrel protein [Sphingobacteriaceae bacterium]
MKKLLLITLITFIAYQANSQVRIGAKAGVNFTNIPFDFKNSNTTVENKPVTSFLIGAFTEFKLMPKIFLQPGLELSGHGTKLDDGSNVIKANIMYLGVPVNVVGKLNLGLGTVSLGGGPYFAYALSGKGENNGVEEDLDFGNKIEDEFKKTDFGINLLGGYQLNSGLGINLGYQLGLSNISSDAWKDSYTSKNTGFSVSLTYMLKL